VQALPAKSVPQGWSVTAEEKLPPRATRGSSRIDVLIRGPRGKRIEVDWKRSVRAGVTTEAQRQMAKHGRHIAVEAEKRAARERELRRRAAAAARSARRPPRPS
jgi:hypothetical protein